MTAVEPHPAAEDPLQEPGPARQPVPGRPGLSAWAAHVLRRQVLGIISDVIEEPDTEPQVRLGLRRHLDANPGRPERALLAHLYDWQAREDRPRE